jgi:hypothetical protein
MEGARIIKLEGPVNVTASSFEEAFGEYSELRGRGRARRAARRADRQEKKRARIQDRQATRSARKQARIQKRADAMRARQEKRTARMQMAQDRRMQRKQARVQRRALGREEEMMDEENLPMDEGQGGYQEPLPPRQDEGGYVEEGGAPEQGGGFAYEEEGGYPEEGGGYGNGMGESETTEDSDIYAAEEEAFDEEGYGADGINYEDLGSTDDLLTLEPNDFYSYMDDYAGADGQPQVVKAKINPEVKKTAMKAEWNKELITRLKAQIDNAMSAIDKLKSRELKTGQSQADNIRRYQKFINSIRAKIDTAMDRALSFDGSLDEYSGADDYSEIRGKRGKSVEKRRRNAEVKAARQEARKARVKSRKQNIAAKRMARKGLSGESVIPVEEQLQPEFDTQRITIPAEDLTTGADGRTGLIALDEANDIDAPVERQIDIKLGVDGSKTGGKKINWLGIGIGVAIAGIAIWYGKKKKLF